MDVARSAVAERFSIIRGGPVRQLLAYLGKAAGERPRILRRIILAVLLTWLPLLVLTLLNGMALGSRVRIPFLRDFAVNVRFLITVPILILAEPGIDGTWHRIALQFLRSGVVTKKGLPSYEAVMEKIMRVRDRVLPEAVILVCAYIPVFFFTTEPLMSDIATWHTAAAGSATLSPAGAWFTFVSAPLFRFLMLRWLWRLCLWTVFLWRTSRLDLNLVASHTDLAAGLGFLSEGQKAFSPIVFAGGAVIAASVGDSIAFQGATLSSMKVPMIAYGVFAIILLIAPLFVVSPVLLRVKKNALFEYGALVAIHNQLFDAKWIRRDNPRGEVILGSEDASSLGDLGASYTVIRQMVSLPINRATLIMLAAAAAAPMAVLALFVTPVDELLRLVLKMLK